MSYSNKREAAKLRSMEKFCKKHAFKKNGECTSKKIKLTMSVEDKMIDGTFCADVLFEMLEYYNGAE